MSPPSVVFVCTANICRSPMAVALLRRKVELKRQSDPSFPSDWRVESAGTWAREGDPAAPNSQAVMGNRGLDLAQHRSRVVTFEMLREFNLILTLERGHKEALRAEFPSLIDRIYTISEMSGRLSDVVDPYGGPLADYEDTARELEQLLDLGFGRICQLAQEEKPIPGPTSPLNPAKLGGPA